MIKVVNLIENIKTAKGTKEKSKIVADNKDNKLLKRIFEFNYGHDIKTHVSTKKMKKDVSCVATEFNITNLYQYMDFLQNICSGKNSDVKKIKETVAFFDKEYHNEKLNQLALDLAIKNLKLGTLGRKNISKIYGDGFLDKIESMGGLAYLKNKDKKDIVGKKIYWSLKLDGFRIHAFLNKDGTSELYSRQGHKLTGFAEIEKEFKKLNYPRGYVIDFEVRLPKKDTEVANECFLRTQTIFASDGDKTGLEARVFDMIPIESFSEGIYEKSYEERRALIDEQEMSDIIKPTEILYVGNDEIKIREILVSVVQERREEGIIGYVEGFNWRATKTRAVLKYKPFKEVDLRVLGYEEGKEGKQFEGMLGSLVVDWKGFPVGVSSGLLLEQRQSLWEKKESLIGKIIQISYMQETHNDKGEPSLRHPAFMRFRIDKDTINYEG